jgi:hypothetical protein
MDKMSLLSPENIRNHLANNSPSKVAHAFSKGKRFKSPNPEYNPPHAGAKWPSIATIRANPRGRGPPSAREKDMILPKTWQKHPLPPPTLHARSSPDSIALLPSESAENNLQNSPIFTDS